MSRERDAEPEQLPRLDPQTIYILDPLDSGEKFSLGSMFIRDPGGPVEILEVQPLMSGNVEFLGAIAIWPREFAESKLAVGPGFPAPEQEHHHPAFGVVVPAAEFDHVPEGWTQPADMTITAGFRIREGDIGAVNGVTLVYRVGDEVRREHFAEAVIGCVKPRICESPLAQPGSDVGTLRDLGLLEGN